MNATRVDLYLRIAWKVEKKKNKEMKIKSNEFLSSYLIIKWMSARREEIDREKERERVNWLVNLIIIMVDLKKWTENER